jgi:hypothetical protein
VEYQGDRIPTLCEENDTVKHVKMKLWEKFGNQLLPERQILSDNGIELEDGEYLRHSQPGFQLLFPSSSLYCPQNLTRHRVLDSTIRGHSFVPDLEGRRGADRWNHYTTDRVRLQDGSANWDLASSKILNIEVLDAKQFCSEESRAGRSSERSITLLNGPNCQRRREEPIRSDESREKWVILSGLSLPFLLFSFHFFLSFFSSFFSSSRDLITSGGRG